MGIIYALVDRERREWFELGKGLWSELDTDEPILPQAYRMMAEADWQAGYVERVAMRIATFVGGHGPLLLVNDSNVSWDGLTDCTEVGNRYDPDAVNDLG